MKHSKQHTEEMIEHFLPTTPMEAGLIIEGKGLWLTLDNGNRLLDLGGGQLCANFGHCNKNICDEIHHQLNKVIHCGARFASTAIIDAINELTSILPKKLTKINILSTGTEANEFAIRLAKLATGRLQTLAAEEGYLGTSLMLRSLSLQFIDECSQLPRVKECIKFSIKKNSALDCISIIEQKLNHNYSSLASIIIEPILGTHGVTRLPVGLLLELRKFCDKSGALLIVDESKTGMGRTGHWFECNNENVCPDILVFSKCVGNGYPVACVAITERVASAIHDKGFYYLSSHGMDPLACRAVAATIREAKRIDAPKRSKRLGGVFKQLLKSAAYASPLISEIRGAGLLLGIECCRLSDQYPADKIARRIFQTSLKYGVIFGYGDWHGVLRLAPPLTINEEEILFATQVFSKALKDVEREIAKGCTLPQWESPPPVTEKFLQGLNSYIERVKYGPA